MGYTVHGILQVRILEWIAFPFSRGSSQPRDQTQVSRIAGRFFTNWAIKEDNVSINYISGNNNVSINYVFLKIHWYHLLGSEWHKNKNKAKWRAETGLWAPLGHLTSLHPHLLVNGLWCQASLLSPPSPTQSPPIPVTAVQDPAPLHLHCRWQGDKEYSRVGLASHFPDSPESHHHMHTEHPLLIPCVFFPPGPGTWD